MPEVQTQKIDFGGARGFTVAVHGALLRQGLSDASARLLTAHAALSTGWGKAVDNYRLAGIKASASWRASRPYVVSRGCDCREGYVDRGDPNCGCSTGKGQFYSEMYWRAYDTLDEATADFIGVLRASRYTESWRLLQAGSPEYFAQVGRDGWYTADPAQTKTSMMRFYKKVNEYIGGESGSGDVASLAIAGALVWLFLRA